MSTSRSFPKARRLLRRHTFLRAARKGRRLYGHYLIVEAYRRPSDGLSRLGITASKKYGKAHERNRFKRIVREAFRHSYEALPPSYDLVVKPKPSAKNTTMAEIQGDLIRLLDRL